MGLILLKDRNGEYRKTWYAAIIVNGKRTSRALKTPLRGKIPLDEYGRFSLNLTGDASFEASKAAAKAELESENRDRKDSSATSRRNAEALGVKPIRISALADENAKRRKYKLVIGSEGYKYNKSVYDILAHFAKWTASRPKKRNRKKYNLITDIDNELVREYYAEISQRQSWQTFRKYVFILKRVFRDLTNGVIANPFQIQYSDYNSKKSEFGEREEIAHKPPSKEQMHKAWEYAKSRTDKPYLYRLLVVATCTGLRIGDCCTLEWKNVDLKKGSINRVITKKTKVEVTIPIFDSDTTKKDYNREFGELRKELEDADNRRDARDVYVIPEAARIYITNRSRIYEEGKDIFAHAIADADKPEDAVFIEANSPVKTPTQIIEIIESSSLAVEKKNLMRNVYESFVLGKTYRQISQMVGKRKSAISEILAKVERLTGTKIRPGATKPSRREYEVMMAATRLKRGQGQRAACLYGWHSCRMYFVGVAFYDIGMSESDLIKITGHTTFEMVRYYIETSSNAAIVSIKRKNRERNLINDFVRRSETPAVMPCQDIGENAPTLVPLQPSSGILPILAQEHASGHANKQELINALQLLLTSDSLTTKTKDAIKNAFLESIN